MRFSIFPDLQKHRFPCIKLGFMLIYVDLGVIGEPPFGTLFGMVSHVAASIACFLGLFWGAWPWHFLDAARTSIFNV